LKMKFIFTRLPETLAYNQGFSYEHNG